MATADGAGWSDTAVTDSDRGWGAIVRLASRVRAGRFDLGILLPNSFRIAAVARIASIGQIVGYDRDARGWLLHRALPVARDRRGRPRAVPTVDYYQVLGRAVGLTDIERTLSLGVVDGDVQAADELLADAPGGEGPLVLLNPGASFGPSKMWELSRWASLADALIARRGARVILNAAPCEQPLLRQIPLTMKHSLTLDFSKRTNTIGVLKAVTQRCELVVTGDTGVRHIAAAFGTGVVTIFGSTDPEWARIDYGRERIIRHDVWCSPCQRKMCVRPPGPVYHECMSTISVEEVLEASEAALDEGVR